jgi:hypothetical protein
LGSGLCRLPALLTLSLPKGSGNSRYRKVRVLRAPTSATRRASHFHYKDKQNLVISNVSWFQNAAIELFEQHLDAHSEAFIICCLAVFLMFFGSIHALLVSKSTATNLSFLFRSSALPHAAISCHVNATFPSRICVIPQNVVSKIARCRMNPNHQKLPAQFACLSLTPMSPSATFCNVPFSWSVYPSSGASLLSLDWVLLSGVSASQSVSFDPPTPLAFCCVTRVGLFYAH